MKSLSLTPLHFSSLNCQSLIKQPQLYSLFGNSEPTNYLWVIYDNDRILETIKQKPVISIPWQRATYLRSMWIESA